MLIAEDELGVARLLEILMQRKGYETAIAEDGAQAMRSIDDSRPDLILLDLIMPVMSGYKVLEELKGDPATADIPIVLVTTDENLSRIDTTGVEHVTKPFDVEHLDAAVERALLSGMSAGAA